LFMGKFSETEQIATSDHSLRWIIGAMVVGVLATGGAIFYALKSGSSVETESAPSVMETSNTQTASNNQPISALGRIAPMGEIFKLSASPGSFGGSRVEKILMREGDTVKEGQVVAVLDSYEQKTAAVMSAREAVKVAQANLAIVEAGAKPGEIAAQQAQVAKAQAELQQEFAVNQATLASLVKQLEGEKIEQQATIDRLQAEVRQAELDDRRYRALAENGAIALADWEQRRLTLETSKQRLQEAKARLMKTEATLTEKIREQQSIRDKDAQTMLLQRESARATLAQISEIRKVDVEKAKAELDLSLARFNEAKAELDKSVVRAPVEAQVLKIYTRPGEKIDDQDGIADLGITSQMTVIAEVYENDVARVKNGQTAWIKSENDSFTGELEGRVGKIGYKIGKNDVLDADPAADIDARVVEVTITLSPQASKEVARLSNANVLVTIEPN
ncbi:MAG: HlyD family efflux transporter periplasmic adaptor subunit, partial [Synechocystis sp.]|nr:HlyD family efflux transporter periplasmic adaptor subunit [Synechocystis sp.]